MTKYFTQFDESTQTIGTNLVGWTTRNGTPSSPPAYGTPPVKRRYLALSGPATSIAVRSWDAIDSDANRDKFDLVIGFSYDALTASQPMIYARGTAFTDWYRLNIFAASGLTIDKSVASAVSFNIGVAGFTFSAGKSYFVRFQGNGTAIKARAWDAALGMAGEPTTWNISITDSGVTAAGWVGLGTYHASVASTVSPFNFFAVGTNGDSAPCPRTNTEYQAWLASQSAKRCVLAEFTASGYDPTAAPYTKTVNARISNMGFTSKPWDTPASTYYPDVIKGIPSFSRVLNTGLTGASTTNFGDLVVDNSRPAAQPTDVTTMGLTFDGVSQCVTLSATTNIPIAFTIEAWVRIRAVATGSTQIIFIATDAGNNYVALFVDASGNLTLSRVIGGVSSGSVTSFAIFPFGSQLIHVAATVGDGGASNAKVYVNGVLVGSANSWTAAAITQPGAIGATPAGASAIAGSMDEVRLWNVAKTAAQLLAYKNTRATGSETGLIGCWHFDEGIGTTAEDSSPTANNGTLTSATMWSMTGMPKSNTAWGGERDDWLRIRWKRTQITMLLGDEAWPRHDFGAILVGRIGQPTAPSQDRLVFKITDLMDVFNTLVTTTLANGPYYPYLMGDMGGMIEPPEIDTATLKFQISNGAILAQTGGVQAIAYDNLVAIQGVAGLTVSSVNTGTGAITASANHGFVNGYRVVFTSGTAPLGLALNTNYWVVATTPGTAVFSLSATQGGATLTGGAATTGAGITGYGYSFDETNGTMTLAAAHVGRVTVSGVRNNNLTSGYVDPLGPADVYNQLVFGAQGLALSKNFQDANSFTALDAANNTHSQALGVWMDSQRHTVADALSELARMSYTIYGFTFDGLMQVAQLGLPGTAVATFTEDDVMMGSLKMVDGIRAIDFSKTTGYYAKWYAANGAFSKPTPESVAMAKTLSDYSYGASSVPLDNYPPLADSDTVTEFRCATTIAGTSTTGATYLRTLIANLYQKRLGVFEFQTKMAALAPAVTLGATIALQHSRLGFKVFSNTDPASPDAVSSTFDATLLVVSGITVNLESGGAFPVTIRGFRPLPGYYSMTDL